MKEERALRSKSKSIIAAISTIFFWATAFPIARVLVQHINALYIAEARVLMAALVFIIMGLFKGVMWPKGRDWFWFLGAALSGNMLYQIFFNEGVHTITSATSSVLVALTPLTTAVLASILYKEKLSLIGWLCIITAFFGVVLLLLWNGIFAIKIGAIYTLIAMFLFSIFNMFNRYLLKKGYDSFSITLWSMVLAALVGFPILGDAWQNISNQPISFQLAIIYLGLFSSGFANMLWSVAINYAEKTADVTTFMFLSPVLATLMGAYFLGELPDLGFLFGGLIILVSLFIFNA